MALIFLKNNYSHKQKALFEYFTIMIFSKLCIVINFKGMKRMFLSFISICFVMLSFGQKVDLKKVRKDFNKGVQDEVLCKQHYETLRQFAKTDVEKGYEAAFQMFMARHTGNPIKKMNYFKGGKGLLESQIKSSPNSVELRFIRLCIQHHIPKYMGYKGSIREDRGFIVDNLYKLPDPETKEILYNYLKGANIYSDEELQLLRR